MNVLLWIAILWATFQIVYITWPIALFVFGAFVVAVIIGTFDR